MSQVESNDSQKSPNLANDGESQMEVDNSEDEDRSNSVLSEQVASDEMNPGSSKS